MSKKKIQVTDEQIRRAGDECSTLSSEYWLAMTSEQQERLEELRKSSLSRAANRVSSNEESAGIDRKMEQHRRSTDDEAIRDLYFGIPDESARVKAINDLLDYERQ